MQRRKRKITFAAELICSKYFCYSIFENSTSTGKIALLSGIRCIFLYVGQLQPSGVWFHQAFWFNIEFYRHSIMCSASWNFILASPPHPHLQSENLQTGIVAITGGIWPDKATVDSKTQFYVNWLTKPAFLQNCQHVNRAVTIFNFYTYSSGVTTM